MKKQYMLILILILVVGFASVTTSLILKGNIGVGVELDDFDVIFIEALLDGKEDSKAVISEDKKTITFTTDRFINKGDTARLDYKVKNTSTQYDADVTINCTNEASEYVTVTSEFDGNRIPLENPVNIKAQEVKSGYISAELSKTYAGEDDSLEISCKITFTATSSEDYAYSLTFDSNGGSKVEDKVIILDKAYGELSIPTKEGYTFLGWYDELDEKVDSSTILDSKGDRTLYAKWEEKVYPVSIITNANGISEINSLKVAYGKDSNIKITPSNNYYISNVECDNGYTVEEYNSKVPEYGEQTIKIKNNEVDKSGTCSFSFEKGIYEYGYTGSEQSFSVPLNGNYKIELWGAGSFRGTLASYTSGNINLIFGDLFYIYVGQYGNTNSGGYNGGGSGRYLSTLKYYYGGGSTDIRLINGNWNSFDSLKSRIMVASGSGSVNSGGLTGYTGYNNDNATSYGGTQTSGGSVINYASCGSYNGTAGGFGYGGVGGSADTYTSSGGAYTGGVGGGSGYYGGGGSSKLCSGFFNSGSGSSFISGHSGCDAIAKSSTSSKIVHTGQSNHYSGYVFTDTIMIDGSGYNWTTSKGDYIGMPTHDGTGTMTGNSGNGYAKITLISIN